MKPLVIANWKCNPITLAEAKKLFDSVRKGSLNIKNVEIVICPPFIFLTEFSLDKGQLELGAQDCFWKEKGAYTGEISPRMLKELGCQYVIVGHSERRGYFGETDLMINKKLKAALGVGLRPILCVGETAEEKEKGQTESKLKSQLKTGLADLSEREIQNLDVAYEPIWAIGTGNPCSSRDAQSIASWIRKFLIDWFGKSASKVRVLYGGSVNSQNTIDYVKKAKTDGLLVGGASLKPEEFIGIIKAAKP